ncbi:MAG: hypothetical protein IJZ89_04610 [Clostridia bacterium]|nr:hypothetical protein [Clostridia bacterium]
MIDKYLEENGLLARIDDWGRKYIKKCIDDPEHRISDLCISVKNYAEKAAWAEKNAEEWKKEFCRYGERITALVNRYNETLFSHSIWKSIGEAEANKKMRTYYSFIHTIDKYENNKRFGFINISCFEKLFEESITIDRNISLCEIAMDIAKINEVKSLHEARKLFDSLSARIDDISRKSAELSEKVAYNEVILGRYLSDLSLALDAKNKGENMNISAARKCNLFFITNYKTK